ncbi:MAG: hypothetical protein R3A48_25375 [Polyangiales bacterium]
MFDPRTILRALSPTGVFCGLRRRRALLRDDLGELAASRALPRDHPVVYQRPRHDPRCAASLGPSQVNVSHDGVGEVRERCAASRAPGSPSGAIAALRDAGVPVGVNFVLHPTTSRPSRATVRRARGLGARRSSLRPGRAALACRSTTCPRARRATSRRSATR